MTNHWVDIKNADLILIMGGNAAEAHPCGFKWVTEAKANRKAKLVVVDPRFTRSAAVADFYTVIRPGADIAFLGGVINYLLSNDKIHHEYVKHYTNVSYLVRDDYSFEDGIYSGYDAEKHKYNRDSWDYQIGPDGYVMVDETLQNPRCVYQLMKAHYARYTPDMVEKVCGTPKADFLKVAEMIAGTATSDKVMTILYALGWTQHSTGSQMIRTMAMIQLLLGNIGRVGGGINALRGHANVQGSTDMNLITNVLPGYMVLAEDKEQDFQEYLAKRSPKPLRPNQMSYSQNFPKFWVSLAKAWYGNAATAENNFCFEWFPKIDKPYDVMHMFERMHQGQMNGFICQGFNPLAAVPCVKKSSEALMKLKYLVVIDPLATETSEFWRDYGDYNSVDPSKIQTEVFRLPSTCFAEETGSFTNSGRVIQWHWKAADPPGDGKSDTEIMGSLFAKLRDLYKQGGGAFPDPILNLTWPYAKPASPAPEELAREFNGKALADVLDPKDPTKVLAKAGEQLGGFAQLRDDGSTSCGNWIYSGTWSEKGNLMARRETDDPSGLGFYPNWGFAWPANRRVLYNRANCDPSGKPWDPKRKTIAWDGTKWSGFDVPDMRPDAAPEENVGPFIMLPDGVAHLFALKGMAEGPFPEHYEPFETPLAANPMHPKNPKAISNPAARVFKGDMAEMGKADKFPYVATTYRLTEHFHFWTKNVGLTAIVQPSQFVELDEELAKEKGIASGDVVKVTSNRGHVLATAVVTKRLKPLAVDGKKIHTVGIPIHWGFVGVAKQGFLVNRLTPSVGDANTQTPEYKAFLVNVAKA
ncbi:MAG: formate dehydrogenase-N subunit alpha [Proteobacteria bacterium]|jgi:formate dehydrogenase major subunit|nr:formate dehydrogenase-N subunit alpha [Pseudomonadota bacterium]